MQVLTAFEYPRFSSPASLPPTQGTNQKPFVNRIKIAHIGARVGGWQKPTWRRELQNYFRSVPVLYVFLRLKERELNPYPLSFW